MTMVDRQPTGTFTTQEIARLAAYRAAVTAGFFTDWDGSATETDTEIVAWLHDGESSDGYRFSAQEREHLEQMRAELGRGGYAEDRPAVITEAATDADAGR
jgi:hypothetical protein